MRTAPALLGAGLIVLGAAVAGVATLGPLVFDVLRYRISPTSLNQIVGGDAAALTVVAPITIVPVAIAVGVGALRHRGWARKPVYALLGGYTLIGASVAGMAITMVARHDPVASAVTAAGATLLATLLAVVTGYVYRPLFRRATVTSQHERHKDHRSAAPAVLPAQR